MLDVLDIHTHTTASGHAYNTIYEMAQSASRKGLALLGISDHGPAMEGSASKHYFRSSRCIPRELYGVKILFGCELNIMDYDGGVDLDEVFAGALDYGIASLHDVCITPGSRAENTRAYLKAMENPKVHIIGHPDDGTYAVDFDELVRHARERGVMIDAHVECDILRHRYALELLETVHFPEELVVNRSVDALMAALAEKKA